MPASLTYPGVYIEEIPSGVRPITGVATSITAFVGSVRRGPINNAKRVLNFADFERRLGGLDADSQMSYAVRQFFLNGGSEAVVVRLAKDPRAAVLRLAKAGTNGLPVTAKDQGNSGNNLEVRVDYATGNPAGTFNLLVNYASPNNPSENRTEQFSNLSMNSEDVRYAVDFVNAGSELIKLERLATVAARELRVCAGRHQDQADLRRSRHQFERARCPG